MHPRFPIHAHLEATAQSKDFCPFSDVCIFEAKYVRVLLLYRCCKQFDYRLYLQNKGMC